jgi:hypothetical protein
MLSFTCPNTLLAKATKFQDRHPRRDSSNVYAHNLFDVRISDLEVS